jgi:hypothetical protein
MYNKFSTLLRIYYYNDPHMGYGDAGTFRYVKVSKKEFTKEINERIDGSTWTKHIATPELKERLKSLGWDYYGMGMDFATKEKYDKEVAMLRNQLQLLEIL